MRKIFLIVPAILAAGGLVVWGGVTYKRNYDKSQQPQPAQAATVDGTGQISGKAAGATSLSGVDSTPSAGDAKVKPPPSQILVTDLVAGTGAEAANGKKITVNYVGTLFDTGAKFDSSYDRGQPFSFTLGAGQVIAGWDGGVKGMKVGGKRKLVIPPDLAYGDKGAGSAIPPNATLVFEVELLAVQ